MKFTKEYKIKIYRERKSGFYIISCEKPNLTTQGKTFVEAFKGIGEAIKLIEEDEE